MACKSTLITSANLNDLAYIKGLDDNGCDKYESPCDLVKRILANSACFEHSGEFPGGSVFLVANNGQVYSLGEISVAQPTIADVNATVAGDSELDFDLSKIQRITMGAGNTNITGVNIPIGEITIIIIQDPVGNRLGTWDTIFQFADGFAPVLSTDADAKDVFKFTCDGSSCVITAAVFNLQS